MPEASWPDEEGLPMVDPLMNPDWPVWAESLEDIGLVYKTISIEELWKIYPERARR